ncbi:MAG: TauD/TfdA family dioxygenase [Myxococcota bacterium]|nr:TauD/TfdA family dioxygenase [Myxococcota bacterium]
MPGYLSYAEQSAHYFAREHTRIPEGPVSDPAHWEVSDLGPGEAWRFRLSQADVEEIEAAIAVAREKEIPLEHLRPEDFPLPLLSRRIGDWRETIGKGRGFQVVSGAPVDRWTREESETFFWCLGLHMGKPGAQNPQGDLLGEVRDTGGDETDPFVRLYQTRSSIAYHCDAADVVGLLCLRGAQGGGVSRIASSVAVYNSLLSQRPDLAPRLFEPFSLDIRNEDRSRSLHHLPISPCRFAEGRLRTFYHSDYFRSAQRHPDVVPFTEDESALLDLYEEIANDREHRLEMMLEPGDIQWLSNHVIIHARSSYQDPIRTESGRELLRLWLSLE